MIFEEWIYMKAKVNPRLCNGTGLCQETCPDIFELKDGIATVKVSEVSTDDEEICKEAASNCPTEAITIVED
jgi:ferredoxin